MNRRISLLLVAFLLFSPVFAQDAFLDLIEANFDIIVSAALFVIAFSLIFPVSSNFTDNVGASIGLALPLSLVFAMFNLTNPAFSSLVYQFLFAVPYGLLVLLGLLIVLNVLFNKNGPVKVVSSIILGFLFLIVLLSGDVIALNLPEGAAEEATTEESILFFVIIGIILVVTVGVIIWRMRGKEAREGGRQRKKTKTKPGTQPETTPEPTTSEEEQRRREEDVLELSKETSHNLEEFTGDYRDASKWFKKLYKLSVKADEKKSSTVDALKLIAYGRFFTGLRDAKGVEHYVPGVLHDTRKGILGRVMKNMLIGRRLLSRIIPREDNRRFTLITQIYQKNLPSNNILTYLNTEERSKIRKFLAEDIVNADRKYGDVITPYKKLFTVVMKEEGRRPSFKHLFSGKLKTRTSVFLPRFRSAWNNMKDLLIHNHSFTGDYEINVQSFDNLISKLDGKLNEFDNFLKELERINIVGIDKSEGTYYYVSIKTPFLTKFIQDNVSVLSHIDRINVPVEYLATEGVNKTTEFIVKSLRDGVKKQRGYKNYDWEGLRKNINNILRASVNNLKAQLRTNSTLFKDVYECLYDLSLLVRSARLYYKSLRYVPFKLQEGATINFENESARIRFLSHLHLYLNYSRDFGDPITGPERFYFNRRVFYKLLKEYFINFKEDYDLYTDDFTLKKGEDSYDELFKEEGGKGINLELLNFFRKLNNKIFNFVSGENKIVFMPTRLISVGIIKSILNILCSLHSYHPNCSEELSKKNRESMTGDFKEVYEIPFDFIGYLLSPKLEDFFDIYLLVVYEKFKKIFNEKGWSVKFKPIGEVILSEDINNVRTFFVERIHLYSKKNGFASLTSFSIVRGKILFLATKSVSQVLNDMYKLSYDYIYNNLVNNDICFQCGADLKKKNKCPECGSIKNSKQGVETILKEEIIRNTRIISRELREIIPPKLILKPGQEVKIKSEEVIKSEEQAYKEFISNKGFENAWKKILSLEGDAFALKLEASKLFTKTGFVEDEDNLLKVFEIIWEEYVKVRTFLINNPEANTKNRFSEAVNNLVKVWPNFKTIGLTVVKRSKYERVTFEDEFLRLLYIEKGVVNLINEKIGLLLDSGKELSIDNLAFKESEVNKKVSQWKNSWEHLGKEASNLQERSDFEINKKLLDENLTIQNVNFLWEKLLGEKIEDSAFKEFQGETVNNEKLKETFEVFWNKYSELREQALDLIKEQEVVKLENKNFYLKIAKLVDPRTFIINPDWINIKEVNLNTSFRELVLSDTGFVGLVFSNLKELIDKNKPINLRELNLGKKGESIASTWKKQWRELGNIALLLETAEEKKFKKELQVLEKSVVEFNKWDDLIIGVKAVEMEKGKPLFNDFVKDFEESKEKGYLLSDSYTQVFRGVFSDIVKTNLSDLDDFMNYFVQTCLLNEYESGVYDEAEIKKINNYEQYKVFQKLVYEEHEVLTG